MQDVEVNGSRKRKVKEIVSAAKKAAEELTLELGRSKVKNSERIQFAVLNETLGKMQSELVIIKRERFEAGKALLEKDGSIRILRQKVKEFRRMEEEKLKIIDSLESGSDSDAEDFMAWDEVRLLVDIFVDLDDGMAEMMNSKLAAEKMIASVM